VGSQPDIEIPPVLKSWKKAAAFFTPRPPIFLRRGLRVKNAYGADMKEKDKKPLTGSGS